jgi:hypothetical protein
MILLAVATLAAIALLPKHADARFGGGFGGGGFHGSNGGSSGFHFGGDGFGGGNLGHSSWSDSNDNHHDYGSGNSSYHPDSDFSSDDAYHPNGNTPYSANQTRYNEAQSMNQTRYSEAHSLQHQHYENESNLSQQHYNQATNLQSNSSGKWDPYGGCCESSGGSEAGAAALGMVGGMALGATMEAAAVPRQSTTIVENVSSLGMVPIGTILPVLPTGAFSTQVNGTYYYYYNGTYYKPMFSGSQWFT